MYMQRLEIISASAAPEKAAINKAKNIFFITALTSFRKTNFLNFQLISTAGDTHPAFAAVLRTVGRAPASSLRVAGNGLVGRSSCQSLAARLW